MVLIIFLFIERIETKASKEWGPTTLYVYMLVCLYISLNKEMGIFWNSFLWKNGCSELSMAKLCFAELYLYYGGAASLALHV